MHMIVSLVYYKIIMKYHGHNYIYVDVHSERVNFTFFFSLPTQVIFVLFSNHIIYDTNRFFKFYRNAFHRFIHRILSFENPNTY